MKYADIYDFLKVGEFRPFRIFMNNGQTFEVHRRELTILTLNSLYFYRFMKEGETRKRGLLRICALGNIAVLEPLELLTETNHDD